MRRTHKRFRLGVIYAATSALIFLVSVGMLAQLNGDGEQKGNMFRKNVSKEPLLTSAKAKLNVMGYWIPAYAANDTRVTVVRNDEDGNPVEETIAVKPLVVTYAQDIGYGDHDAYAAVSRDDGATWKRKNISRMADRTSFTLANGSAYYGHCTKPVMQVKGNKILIAWTSKYAKGGKPRYAIDPADEYVYDDPYWVDDIWGVAGSQGSVDYTELGYPEVGEVPYSAVWICRGVIANPSDVAKGVGDFVGDIVWFKPERLTSARRDALQVFCGGADGAGFAIAWQEDPDGLDPGKQKGPGHGWSGASVHKRTDIWYSYITWGDFAKVDKNYIIGGDPEHNNADFTGRPKALVPMSLPVRVSDNEVVNVKNAVFYDQTGAMIPGTGLNLVLEDLDGDGFPDNPGTRRYISQPVLPSEQAVPGLWNNTDPYSDGNDGFHTKINQQGVAVTVAVTADGRLLSGNSGACRPNLFLQTYTKPDGSKSAWAIMGYEETYGIGSGPPDDHDSDDHEDGGDKYISEEGKGVIFHSFDFQNPDRVSAGNMVNYPSKDENGNDVYVQDETGALILDWKGSPILAHENARRPRFILQGKSAIGRSGTALIVIYKEGPEGKGRPSDIMARRCVPTGPGNPYAYKYFVPGFQNLSAVTPTVTGDTWGDPENENDPRIKVFEWEQTEDNLDDQSWENPSEEARAHRGQIRGDYVIMGYVYTPNWAAARNFHDRYDFYIRRSFDGGQTWTNGPATSNPQFDDEPYFGAMFHQQRYRTQEPGVPVEEVTLGPFQPGEFEPARNMTLLKNNFETVIEPRIVATPGTIKVNGVWSGMDEDLQDRRITYFAYGTESNEEFGIPLDLFWTVSENYGQTFEWYEWTSQGDVVQENVSWPWLAHSGGNESDEEDGEVQLRTTPSGERMYACWLQEDPEGSDIYFRRILNEDLFPTVDITSFAPEIIVQDDVTFASEAFKAEIFLEQVQSERKIESVFFYLRQLDEEGDLVEVGQEDLLADQTEKNRRWWLSSYATSQVPDGPYVLMAKAVDIGGKGGWSDLMPISILNQLGVDNLEDQDLFELLPATSSHKAGRTIPIKFSLKSAEGVDPPQTFVYNEDLSIKVYKVKGIEDVDLILKEKFLFGKGSDHYRIDLEDQKYIANFKTDKYPAEYLVKVTRLSTGMVIGEFSFVTTK